MFNTLQHSDYPIFPFNGRRVSHLILNTITTPRKRNNKMKCNSWKPAIKNSLTHCFRLLKAEQQSEDLIVTLSTDKQIQSKKFINLKPLKNAIEKINTMRQQILSRRKSAYGEMFGELTAKQFQNLPTQIEQHRQIDIQRFALTSFADILERKKQKRNTRKPSLLRKLSKQDTALVEYDQMERPPSCKTPPRQLIIKIISKSKIQLEQEKYFKEQGDRMLHFLAGKQEQFKDKILDRKKTSANIQPTKPQSSSVLFLKQRNSLLFPQLCLNKISRCITNCFEKNNGPQLSSRSIYNQDRPYIRQNKILSKQIQSEIKNLSHSLQRSSYNL